jgi:predicted metalloendopeptidase
MDRSVAPGDDFVRYTVGKWVDTTEIPPDRSSLGSVAVIKEKASARVRGIIEDAAQANAPEGSDGGKIGDYEGPAGAISRADRAQPRCVVLDIRREAGPDAVSRSR